MRSIDRDEVCRVGGGDLELLGKVFAKLGQFRPRSELVRRAQIELLLHHTRFQTVAAPGLGLFIVIAFADPAQAEWAWGWMAAMAVAYMARLSVLLGKVEGAEDELGVRLKVYLIGLGACGLLWAMAPYAIAPMGSDGQFIAGVFVCIAVLVGIVGNFLYHLSAAVYLVTWILPALITLGDVYTTRFEAFGWTYAGVVVMLLIYAYKCLEVINLPIGETLELNEALVVEKDRAEASDRAKSDFLAMMSHELRTPLNAIMGFSEIIRDQIYGPHSNKKYIEQAGFIREAGGLLSDLISDLLELSALEARGRELKIEEVEVGGLVKTALQLLQDTATKRQIVLIPDVPDGLPVLSIDRRAAIQCLTNIVGNAIKYAPEMSDVRVTAENTGGYVRIHVHDRGPGIPEEELGRVTEPFRRGTGANTRHTQGVGLGLAISENLMKRHSGSLEIVSSPDDGTTVSLLFPVAADASA